MIEPGSGVSGRGPALRGVGASGPTRAAARCLLPVTPAAPHLAREFVRTWACPDHLGDSQEAILLVSELVTNALVHGEGPIELTVSCAKDRAVIAVTDGGARLPVIPAKAPVADAVAGRGLWMLVSLADDWGVRVDADTKTMWFAMANQPPVHTVPLSWSRHR